MVVAVESDSSLTGKETVTDAATRVEVGLVVLAVFAFEGDVDAEEEKKEEEEEEDCRELEGNDDVVLMVSMDSVVEFTTTSITHNVSLQHVVPHAIL